MSSKQTTEKTIAIVGAGLAGLSCAVRLKELGHHLELFEKSRGPAGRMSTKRGEGWSADHGALPTAAKGPLRGCLCESRDH